MVQLYPFPPFSIVSRLSREHRDVGVALCRALRWCRGSWHSSGSPYLRIQWSKSGAGRSNGRWYTVRGPALGSAQQGPADRWLRYQCKSSGSSNPSHSLAARSARQQQRQSPFQACIARWGLTRPPWANSVGWRRWKEKGHGKGARHATSQ